MRDDERKRAKAQDVDAAAARDAAQLRRSAEWFDRHRMPATAILFRNAALIAEHGVEFLSYIRCDGATDDVEVRP